VKYLPSFAYAACISLCISLMSCITVSTQSTIGPTTTSVPTNGPDHAYTDCDNDAKPPMVASGWTLLWQHTFEQSVARPPQIDEAQLLILERTDPFAGKMKDTLWAINPETAEIQWRFDGVNGVPTYATRQITGIEWSQKYVALHVLYKIPESTPVYVVVADRLTGQMIYSTTVYVDEATVSDDALYYRGIFRELYRVDLPNGDTRWSSPAMGGNGLRGLFLINSRLYAFNNDKHVYQYDPLSGSLVASTVISSAPTPGDVLIQDHQAVVRSWYGYEGVILFDVDAFAPKWATKVPFLIGNTPTTYWGDIPSMSLAADSIYLFDAMDNLLSLDLSTGQVKWSVPPQGAEALSRPIATHGLVYGLFADGTLRAFSETNGAQVGIVMKAPVWSWTGTDREEWRDVVGGLGAVGDTLIVTTGCRSVYAIQREP